MAVTEASLEAAILEHHAICKRRVIGVTMWAVGLALAAIMAISTWAYDRAAQISVLDSRVNSIEKDISEIRGEVKTLPRIEEKVDQILASRRPR